MWDVFFDFMCCIVLVGIKMIIIYVCKVWLDGLSFKENCEILLFDYGIVYDIKSVFLDLMVVINGGIEDVIVC